MWKDFTCSDCLVTQMILLDRVAINCKKNVILRYDFVSVFILVHMAFDNVYLFFFIFFFFCHVEIDVVLRKVL